MREAALRFTHEVTRPRRLPRLAALSVFLVSLFALIVPVAGAVADEPVTLDPATYSATEQLITQIQDVYVAGKIPTPGDCGVPGAPAYGAFPVIKADCIDGALYGKALMKGIKCWSDLQVGKYKSAPAFGRCIGSQIGRMYETVKLNVTFAHRLQGLIGSNACSASIIDLGDAKTSLRQIMPLVHTALKSTTTVFGLDKAWTRYMKTISGSGTSGDPTSLEQFQGSCAPAVESPSPAA